MQIQFNNFKTTVAMNSLVDVFKQFIEDTNDIASNFDIEVISPDAVSYVDMNDNFNTVRAYYSSHDDNNALVVNIYVELTQFVDGRIEKVSFDSLSDFADFLYDDNVGEI